MGRPRPAALPMPGPAGAAWFLPTLDISAGGGPSIVREMTSSPRSNTRPNTLLTSRCITSRSQYSEHMVLSLIQVYVWKY